MRIEKIREPRFRVELTKKEVGIIAYLLGASVSTDFNGTVHEPHVSELMGPLYAGFNSAWCDSE